MVWKKKVFAIATLVLLVAILSGLMVSPALGQQPERVKVLINSGATAAPANSQVVPGQYIVLITDGVDPAAVASHHGVAARHVYRAALKGFAAVIPQQALNAIARDPRVILIEPDRAYTVADQLLPTGIDRVEADKNPNADIDGLDDVVIDYDVAIIDTGINPHDDLNLAGCRNFTGGSPNNCKDGYGHGTHVAGTVGAKDNGFGVVGVAPGVSLWAVRVCNNGGICLILQPHLWWVIVMGNFCG